MEKKLELNSKVEFIDEGRGIIRFSNGFELKVGKALIPKKKPEKTVMVYAFTGMKLGELEVTSETKKEIVTVRGDGKTLIFDKKTGLQSNCKNARFANKIIIGSEPPSKKDLIEVVQEVQAEVQEAK